MRNGIRIVKRSLAVLLSACMIFGMTPIQAGAEETVSENIVQTESAENTENLENAQSENDKSSETESETTTDTEAEDTAIADVQTLIDALPDADSITEDNIEEVTVQLDTIDETKAELSDADMLQLDLTRYDAASDKVMVLMGMQEEVDSEIAVQANDSAGKTEQQSTDEASVTINGTTSYYATLEEAFSAADGKTATITMLNDAECTVTSGSPISVMNKSNITLNMNGKTLSGHGTGDCGIITLATGSLSVQGPGTMKSTFKCLSCQSKNAKMTVENITFDVSEADYGVWVVSSNTVTLNNIQIIGKAKTSAVYQYSNSANVTINNMNAIEAGYSNVVYKGGTLKINGGTFDKISVTSNNTGGITSVSQVLGEGCIYRYADKTWETSELSNTLEISNVTVEKIPLTINPEAEATSWHNNSAEHSLHMNAEPTTAGNDITYEWYDGDTKLECDSDTYTIPKIMSVGNYTYTCKATCDGYTLSHEFTFTVEEEECKHKGVEITFNSNGFGNCPKCNATVYQPATETTDKYDIDDDGTKDTVYEISNAGQLYWFAGLVNGTLDGVEQNASANAILTANITVNENLLGSLQYDTEGNVSNGSNFISWTPIGSWDKDYTGTFDGNNKTVSGLYFNDTSICIGLFGSSEGNIKNVGVVDSYFKGNNFVAGVCGLNIGIIENCYNTGNILTFPEEAANVGGVCGCNSGSITNCYNTGTVTAPGSVPSIVGGVCGSNNGSTTNCYNVGTVIATDSSADVGGVCGVAWGSTTNCYYNSDAYNGDAIGYGSATAYDACKTTAQFASGEVAYLLSQGCTIDEVNYDGTIWGQALGENGDEYPVLDITKRVYQVDKYDGCEGKPGSSTKVYSNQSTSIYEEHKYEADTTDPTKHKCSICNGSEVHSFAYELVENGNAIKATCSECGATYTVKLTQSAATSDEKIVYDGTEKKAGTAIDSGNTGIETIPENAITYAAVTNGTPSTYSTTAPKNAGTYKAKLTLGTGDSIVSIEINFTIEKATPTIAWAEDQTKQSATYTGDEIDLSKLTAPTVTLVNGETFSNTDSISYSYRELEYGTASGKFHSGLPTDRGTYELKASIQASGNYTAAEGIMTLEIKWLDLDDVAATLTDLNGRTLNPDMELWAIAVIFTAPEGYTICISPYGPYGSYYSSFSYRGVPDGEATEIIYYLKNEDGEIGKKTVTVRFVDPENCRHVYEIDYSDHTHHKCKVCNDVEAHNYTYNKVADGITDTIQVVCDVCNDSYTVKLTAPTGTDGKLTYTGIGLAASTEITDGVLGETLPKIEYATVTDGTTSAYSTDIPVNAGSYRARLTLGSGDNVVSATVDYTIAKATPVIAWAENQKNQSATYTGEEIAVSKITAPKVTLLGDEAFSDSSKITYSYRKVTEGTASGDFIFGLPAAIGTYEIKAAIPAEGNYTAAETADTMQLTIAYLAGAPDAVVTDGDNKTYSSDDWCPSDIVLQAPDGYKISSTVNGSYEASFAYTGTKENETITYYLRSDNSGEIAEKSVTVKMDRTAPDFNSEQSGINISMNWWNSLLGKITFGLYKGSLNVNIKADDSQSGVAEYYYYIDNSGSTTTLTAEELGTKTFIKVDAGKNGTTRLTQITQDSSYVFYAYAVDAVGNRSGYICSDGIVLDNTAPMLTFDVPDEHIGDNDAIVEYTINEPGTIYYFFSMESHDGAGIDSPIGLRTDVTFEELMNASVGEGYEDHFCKGTISVSAAQVGTQQELKKIVCF